MRFGVLGPLDVRTADGRAVRVPELKVRALLAALLAQDGHPVSADRLAEDLWAGGRRPGSPVRAVQAKVSQLRRALADAEPGGRELVASVASGYVLDVGDEAVDAARFAALAAQARATPDPAAKAALLADALALWRGPAFADFRDEEFARAAMARLDEQRLTVVEELAEARLALGEHALLADDLGDLVAQHPLRERLRAAHVLALYRAGRQGEALGSFGTLRTRLVEELGLDPGPELVALHQAILGHDPALAAVPVPATSSARPRGNLPAPVTGLVGRSAAVAAARDRLATGRLVTLTGPGGVGKTRLALEVASQVAGEFADGAWFVDLTAIGAGHRADASVAGVAELVAAVLGIRDETGGRPADLTHQLCDALRSQALLLVLDNCEHVVERAAGLVAALLAAAPGLRVLATSREPLAVAGETLQEVPPLGLPAEPGDLTAVAASGAVQLFAERAAATTPGFALDATNAAAVAAICARLDGLPLALELAAARVRALGVHGVAQRLDDRFRLLAGGRRDAPQRQRTLRGVIDWSWELLAAPERAVLRRMAVHAGGCTLGAAEAVCAGEDVEPDAVLDVLARLVDRSLVVAGSPDDADGPRYRLLESVAAYGREQLAAAGELDDVQVRHQNHHTALAERAEPNLYGPDQRRWLQRLDAESANLRVALDGAVARGAGEGALRLVNAMSWYWYLRGRHREARRALGGALAVGGPPAAVARASAWQAAFAMLVGDGDDPLRGSRAALAAYDGVDAPRERARAQWFLAHAHLHFGDVPAGDELSAAALAAFRDVDDGWGIAAAQSSRAKVAMFRGELAAAERAATDSLRRFVELGDRWGRLLADDMLAYHAEVTGDHDTAARLHREDLRIAEGLQLWTDASYRLSGLGRIALLTRDFAAGSELHERARRLANDQGNPFAAEYAQVGLGLGARRQGILDVAEAHLGAALARNRTLHADYGVAYYGITLLLAELGFVAELRGDATRAATLHSEALAAAREVGEPRAVALAVEGLAGAAAVAGDHVRAARLLGAASAGREAVGAPLPPAERGDVDRIAGTARAALGAAAFAEAFTEGTASPLDEVAG
ncbi:BTAD domain-containing putative transcriptional regulator [Pseudonocardia sp. MH-G8]|uniref:AfsR/SARP family transcriptional regulator n=1 Tax=Pseudonocardia sp. MH-G8 TaxID=1854588 RepID=UPI000B9FDCA0|nr:BTAD domain-containing putative transcriptional regulator [Pseudonocardia sp. MH-G8]OZM82775.1 AfsR family transcriptional regulator [Pseudonocardia sp. MH-G8]